jgi:hypothetical protein
VVSQGVQTVGMARPRRHTLFAALLPALFLAGCTSSTTQVTPPLASVAAAPSASPSSTSPEDQAKVSAQQVVQKYYQTIPRCLADPTITPETCFDDVAISSELLDLQNMLIAARQMESKATGNVKILAVDFLRLDLTNKVNVTPPTVPKVTFRVCIDLTQFDMVGQDGKSVRAPTAVPRASSELTVVNYHYPELNQWRVGYQENAGKKC